MRAPGRSAAAHSRRVSCPPADAPASPAHPSLAPVSLDSPLGGDLKKKKQNSKVTKMRKVQNEKKQEQINTTQAGSPRATSRSRPRGAQEGSRTLDRQRPRVAVLLFLH